MGTDHPVDREVVRLLEERRVEAGPWSHDLGDPEHAQPDVIERQVGEQRLGDPHVEVHAEVGIEAVRSSEVRNR